MLKQLRLGFRTLFKYRLYTGFASIGLSIAVSAVWFIADYVEQKAKKHWPALVYSPYSTL